MSRDGSYSETLPVAAAKIETATAITGTVSNGGAPVADVRVFLGSTELTRTTGDGSYTAYDVPVGPQTFTFEKVGYSTKTVVATVIAGSPTVLNVDLLRPTTLELTRKPAATPRYGQTVTIEGRLTSAGTAVAGVRVVLQTSNKTWGFVDTAHVATTTADGRFSISFKPTAKYYRVRFAGDTTYAAASSGLVLVLPHVYITSPSSPKSMSRFGRHHVTCLLRPRHTPGTYPVRIYLWKWSGGKWRSEGYVRAKAYNFYSFTKCLASIRLSHGSWRMRAYAVGDANHAATWSPSYAYTRVR